MLQILVIRSGENFRKKLLSCVLGGFFFFGSPSARAWYDHTVLTPWIVKSIETDFLKDPNHPYTRLHRAGAKPRDPYETQAEFRALSELLLMNGKGKLRSLHATTVSELLTLSPDDPDHGMDQDLPDSADPLDERRHMGGHQAPSSQGFRHMYFAGFNWMHPVSTFQIPTHPVGQGLDRFELLANEGKQKIRSGDVWWGLRIIGWSLHYLQDLTQPFHTNQIPNWKMLPLLSLIHWPLNEIWPHFHKESTRSIENYHWVYEGYVREALLKKEEGPFAGCLSDRSSTLLVSSPRELIEEVVRGSRSRSSRMGSALVDFAGSDLKKKEFHLSKKKGNVDYAALQNDPALLEPRRRLNEVTCESLALAKAGSLWVLKWAFH